uniref:Uncharacterized protein n=1 Tax=Meloidogyne enterolobii TaxID=390850 RepID=A0A6V7VXJ1_MELEN|nr:unnamed protein product [Meloidogyne enterolobii]
MISFVRHFSFGEFNKLSRKLIKPKATDFDFPVDEQLEKKFQQQNAQEADQLQNKQETTKLNGEQQNFLLFWKKKDDEGKNMREYF